MGASNRKLARRHSTGDDERVFFTNKDAELIPSYIFHRGITSLDLSFNRLANIPIETGHLRRLKVLRIQCNLVQNIPQMLCDAMLPLEHLVLDRNQLVIVPDCIGNFTTLIQLHVSRNKIATVSSYVGLLSRLELLDLSSNHLTAVPDSIGGLVSLQILRLSCNALTELPASIANCTALRVLHLQNNLLTTLPNLTSCSSLVSLNASYNNISTVPAGLFTSLPTLQNLQLEYNRLIQLPPTIGNLSHLVDLSVRGNMLSVVPPSLGLLQSLKTLDLAENQITMLPPMCFAQLHALETLDLYQNKLTEFSPDLSALTALTSLNLSNNQLMRYSEALLRLQSISRLVMFENNIEEITEVVVVPEVVAVDAEDNTASSPVVIPAAVEAIAAEGGELMAECVDIDDAPCRARSTSVIVTSRDGDVARIQYTPNVAHHTPPKYLPLPDARIRELFMKASPKLTQLPACIGKSWLRLCSITGATLNTIPAELLGCSYLERLRLPNNHITSVPQGISQLTSLEELNLANNPIADVAELSALTGLTRLKWLVLAGCGLKEIPPSALQLSLQYVDMSNNHISTVPEFTVTAWPRVEVLDLSCNQLTSFPTEVGIWKELRELSLSDNKLTSLPVALQDLALEVFTCDGNLLKEMVYIPASILICDPVKLLDPPQQVRNVSYIHPSRRYDIGYAFTMGARPYMEDGVVIHGSLCGDAVDYIAVFDGHAGVHAMQIAVSCMHEDLKTRLAMVGTENAADALRESFAAINQQITSTVDAGSVALVGLLVGARLFVASLGDARAVLYSSDQCTRLTTDHKAFSANETQAIRKRGGFVTEDGRLCGVLAISRSLGDRELLPFVGTDPDIMVVDITSDTEGLVLGCDGVWDVLSDETAAGLARDAPSAKQAARAVRDSSVMHRSGDNISVVVVHFKPPPSTAGSEVAP